MYTFFFVHNDFNQYLMNFLLFLLHGILASDEGCTVTSDLELLSSFCLAFVTANSIWVLVLDSFAAFISDLAGAVGDFLIKLWVFSTSYAHNKWMQQGILKYMM